MKPGILVKAVALLAAVGTAAYLVKRPQARQPTSRPLSVVAEPAGRPYSAIPSGAPYHGFAIQINTSHEPLKRYGPLLREIADLGADTVLFSTAGYQENSSSAAIFIDQRKTPSPEQWDRLIAEARKCGLRVVLMPIVLLTHPRTSTEWRGVIQPPRWDEWWTSYTDYIMHFAKIAARNRVEVFIIGSELISTENMPEFWDELIRKVRSIYRGKISYSSNWDHYEKVPFWDKLDLVCMTTYYTLSDRPNPPLQKLIDAWKPIKRQILQWQAKVGKPILFTEVGWPSQEGCSIEPWNYFRQDHATPAGLQEQANCYRAFIETWKDVPPDKLAGVIWWEWTPYGGGPNCINYTPKGKPAEEVIRQWFASIRARYRPTAGKNAAK